jgi:hypothetical protein
MSYYGDLSLGQTIRIPFSTNTAEGTPITLAGSPSVAVYKDGGTTEDTDGVSLSVDFDGKTGSHRAIIDTSVDPTFFSSGSDFVVQLAAGTVDGTSVAGAVLGSFSIQNRTVASVKGNVNGNVTGNVSGSVGSVTGAVGSVTGSVGSVVGSVGGNVVGSTASVTGAVGSVGGNVGGDVAGKVLGGGGGTISGDGVRAASVTGAVGSVTGAVGSVTSTVSINLAQTGLAVRDLSAVADAALTVGDALVSAISEMAGDESVVGTAYTKKTPAGTTTRIFLLDDADEPTSRT